MDKALNLLNMASLDCKSKSWGGLGSVQLLSASHFVPGFVLGTGEIRIYSTDIY